jgi:hypothetical protein
LRNAGANTKCREERHFEIILGIAALDTHAEFAGMLLAGI